MPQTAKEENRVIPVGHKNTTHHSLNFLFVLYIYLLLILTWYGVVFLSYCYLYITWTLTNHPINNTQLQLFSYDNRYVDGGVHASDGGRCHPSIRGDIYAKNVFVFICMCVPMCDISILLYCYVSTLTPLYVRPLKQQTTNYISQTIHILI